MRRLTQIGAISALFVFSALFVGPVSVLGQQTSSGQSAVTLKWVQTQLKQNNQYLKNAEKQGKAGDTKGMSTALKNYSRGMTGLNTALSQRPFSGTPSQEQKALKKVKKATSKHLSVLNNLLTKVPAAADKGINQAISASSTGHDTAVNQLSTLHTQQAMQQGNRPDFGQAGGMGRPAGAGRPEGVGGGFPGGAAPMGGAMGHPGGGPPSGHHGR